MPIHGVQFRSVLSLVVAILFVLVGMKTTARAQTDIEEKNRRAVEAGFENWPVAPETYLTYSLPTRSGP